MSPARRPRFVVRGGRRRYRLLVNEKTRNYATRLSDVHWIMLLEGEFRI